MKLQIVIIFILALGISACNKPNTAEERAAIEKEKFADEIISRVASRIKQDTGLRPIGTMGQMLYQIEKLGLSFYYFKPVNIVEGRKLLVQSVNTMLDEINQDKRIHPYLCIYPFLPRNIEMRIILRNSDGGDVAPGALWGVVANEGMLRYKVYDPIKNTLIDVYKETYEEALQRIADPSLPLASFEPDPEIAKEDLARVRKSISFVSHDGSIWHLGENGSWIQDPKSSDSTRKSKP